MKTQLKVQKKFFNHGFNKVSFPPLLTTYRGKLQRESKIIDSCFHRNDIWCKSVLICGYILVFLFCSSCFAVVSDTQSFFETSGSSFSADGSSSVVSIYIKDANNMPLQDKVVNIATARGSVYDSIVQPALTDVNGQCTGIISSLYGGWDTISVTCDLKNIGSPNQWSQTTQEDFAGGETQTNIDTTSVSGSIKIIGNPKDAYQESSLQDDGLYSTGTYVAQSFQVTRNSVLDTVQIWLHRDYTESGEYNYYRVSIHQDNGGNIGETICLSPEYNASELSPPYTGIWKDFIFSDISFSINTTYWLKLTITRCTHQGVLSYGFAMSGSYSLGHLRKRTYFGDGSFWDDDFPSQDMGFRIYIKTADLATYVSRTYNTGADVPPYGNFIADYSTNGQTISFDVRAADTKEGSAGATWYPAVNNGPINAPRKRWVQWRCQIQTGNTDTSPLLNSVTINYRAPKNIYFVAVLKIDSLSASPNPFSPNNDTRKDTTTISYTLIDNNPRDTICLRIYNPPPMIGETSPPQQQVVRTLLNYIPQDTGQHQIVWDGRSDTGVLVTENGAYICQITAIDSFGNSVVNTMPITVDLIKPIPQVTGASFGKQQVELTFEANETIESYYVWRSDGNTNNFQLIASGISTGSFLDTSPIGDNQSYYYRIIVSDLAGNTETSNVVFARMTQDGGIVSNRGNFAISNMVVKCKDDAQAFVTIPETKTFGDTIEFVKIKLIRKNKGTLESEGKIFPVDKKLAGAYEVAAFEVDAGYNEISEIKSWASGKMVNLTFYYENCPADKVNSLAIYEWSGNQWVKRGGSVNSGNQTLNLDTSHFSTYAIMYQTASSFMGAKPNPFSPNNDGINDYVEIRFDNSQNQDVKLSIFDLPGHLVWSRTYSAGSNSVTWDGKDFSGRVVEGGAYIYQVEVGTRVVNGVVVVAK